MKIVVTGGSGKAGSRVVADLVEHGHEVVNVDLHAPMDPDAPTIVADLTDLGQTIEVLREADAVAHLAAVPAPNILPPGETFRTNALSTYNVFHAASILGVRRVVWASSETLIGIPFRREAPRYAPIDEAHPRLPEFHYALAKLVGEEMGVQFSRWTGVPYIALRYSNIMVEADYSRFPGFWEDPTLRSWNLWGYVDARDVAQATRLALESDIQGAEAFLVAAADSCMNRESAELMQAVYPNVPLTRPIVGFETLLSIDKARSVLGYDPAHSWRDYLRVDRTR
jgi:nucleoside-diphosphate-sugar epimerase